MSEAWEAGAEPILYVVATPIGNLTDLSARAREVLGAVDRIAAEDTRNTAQLLNRLGVRKPLMSHHAHNEKQSAEGLLACLARGESVALVSDAGTPAVSDPGAAVVRLVASHGYKVVPVPGASSVLAVVAASGLVEGAFTFRGFLPAKGRDRRDQLAAWLACSEPQVLFEAPHRIVQLMDDLLAQGESLNQLDRPVCAGREMTKQFETFYRGSVLELAEQVKADAFAEKGEWALVLGPWEMAESCQSGAQTLNVDKLIEALLLEVPPKSVVKAVVAATGLPKNEIYTRVMAIKDGH